MSNGAERQYANVLPARRGQCLVIETSSTATAYALANLELAGFAPKEGKENRHVYVTLTALEQACWYHFSPVTAADLSDTAEVAVGGSPAYANTMGACIPAGTSVRIRIDRQRDKFLVLKTASTGGQLALHASSDSFGD